MTGTRAAAVVALAVVAGIPSPQAAQTRLWAESPARLQRGEAEGIAVSSRGRLFLAPRLTRLGGKAAEGREAHVWSVAADPGGDVYLGTGPGGRIVRVSAGRTAVVFTVDEPMVTALARLPGGGLLAGTAPEGRVYRIAPDGTGEVWSETGARYVWALVPSPDGGAFAATGEKGIVYRIGASGSATPLFDSDEPHIVSLVRRDDGTLLAGGAGRGLIYEIDAEGHAFVLHDDDLPEVRALAVRRNGAIVAAVLGPPEPEPRPPAVRIQLPDGAQVGPTAESVGELEETTGPTVEGVIEGLRFPEVKAERALRGRVVEIAADGTLTELWRSTDEAPFALGLDDADRVVFGTGEPGRLYRAEDDREVALLASVGEAQVSELVRSGDRLVAATSNPAAAYRLEADTGDRGTFHSKPFDAGGPARWGTLRWTLEGDGARAELYTRTGNSADPDATWSAWGPALTDPAGSPIVNPEGRFLQWRVRLTGAGARVADVTASYATVNRAPGLRDFRVHPEARAFSATPAFRFNVSDPDGDPVEVRIEYAPPGTGDWRLAVAVTSDPPTHGDGSVWRAGEATWDTAAVAEGPYRVRARASDGPGNPPGEGRGTESDTDLRLIVDRTPPSLDLSASGGSVRVEIRDGHSPIDRLEIVDGDRVLFRARPEDGVCDSPFERFDLRLDRIGGTDVRLRATDAAGNSTESALP